MAVVDIKKFLRLVHGERLAMSLYRPIGDDDDQLRLRLYHTEESLPLSDVLLGPSINLLPILMAVTQWMTMKLSATQVSDPNQRMMMTFMPIMLTVFLFRAPSGLMIYWVAGNIWQMGHQ